MAKTQEPKLPEMSPALKKAMEDHKQACLDYDKTIKRNPTGLGVEQLIEHQNDCSKALADKRYAAAVIEAVRYNKPLPPREKIVEANLQEAK
jgi:hypothetical protein